MFVTAPRPGLLLATTALLLTSLTAGCSRAKYRREADQEVTQLVAEKSYDPRWDEGPCFNINIDPRSRYYDPYDPDHPPMPQDDPDSHQFMH